MKSLAKLSMFTLIFGLWGTPVLAQTQRISAEAAQRQVPTIALKVNQGVNLTLPDGVLAYKGWLDDGSLIQLDGDRPFEQGASVLHLVANQTGQAQLSLVTRDANQVESLYVFKLVAGSQGNSIVNVTAHPVDTVRAATAQTPNTTRQLQQGVRLAIERQLLVENSELHRAIQGAISKIDQGMAMEQAATTFQLDPRTLAQLFHMGQGESLPDNPMRQEPLLVRVEGVSETNNADVEARLTALENQVERLDGRVASLDSQQSEFLAQLQTLDQQQEIFATLLQRQNQVAQRLDSPKSKLITLAINTIPRPTATPVPRTLDNHQIANAIARGLTTHPDTPYRSRLYLRYQTMIRSLRRGSTLSQAARQGNLQLNHVKSVLKNAGVTPEAVGL
ncbi:hypothetical protein [Picosynechococcus sp. NKBG042902]|uniref:hypothetical protein n=1 Tax=Picosynechococcus sp. NKBG042902 TaxID=490193 RepID=UPI001CB79407|nr:hypothetical protein [Picosynechococcus sp. NKBG042902]